MESHSLTLDEACSFLNIARPIATNWILPERTYIYVRYFDEVAS